MSNSNNFVVCNIKDKFAHHENGKIIFTDKFQLGDLYLGSYADLKKKDHFCLPKNYLNFHLKHDSFLDSQKTFKFRHYVMCELVSYDNFNNFFYNIDIFYSRSLISILFYLLTRIFFDPYVKVYLYCKLDCREPFELCKKLPFEYDLPVPRTPEFNSPPDGYFPQLSLFGLVVFLLYLVYIKFELIFKKLFSMLF